MGTRNVVTSPGDHRAELARPAKGAAKYGFDYSWAEENPYVAHAMGAIDGRTYTNSYDAFLRNYEQGHRVFEIDLCLTNDNRTVLTHDAPFWRNSAKLAGGDNTYTTSAKSAEFTYDNFMASRWHGKYRPLDLTGLVQIMHKYPEVKFLIDNKYADEKRVRAQYTELVKIAKEVDPSVLDRVIVSVYTPEMLDVLMEIHPWKSAVCSIYKQPDAWTPEKIRLFLQDSGIEMVCMNGATVTESLADTWAAEGAQIIPFNVSTEANVEDLRELGVRTFITDSLHPQT